MYAFVRWSSHATFGNFWVTSTSSVVFNVEDAVKNDEQRECSGVKHPFVRGFPAVQFDSKPLGSGESSLNIRHGLIYSPVILKT